MGCLRCLATTGSVVVVLVAVVIGSVISGVPRQLGLYRILNDRKTESFPTSLFYGMTPAFMDGIEWGYDFDRLSQVDLKGQTALVTGANSGLGYWTALHLARQGARVVMACRSQSKCEAAAQTIRANSTSTGHVETKILDVSSLASVRKFGAEFVAENEVLDMLVLNAGIGVNLFGKSVDGVEKIFATNHLGHFVLYNTLFPLLESGGVSGAARVVLISSASHYDTYPWGVGLSLETINDEKAHDGAKAYGQSKLSNVLMAQEAARRAEGKPVYINVCHPGMVDTEIFQHFVDYAHKALPKVAAVVVEKAINKLASDFMWRGEDGALTQIYLAAAKDEIVAKNYRGKYFHPQATEVVPCRKHSTNMTLQQKLWEFSTELADSL